MQIKTMMRYHVIPVRMVINNNKKKKTQKTNVGEDVEERECKVMQPPVKTVRGVLKKLKIKLPHDPVFPPLSIYPKKPH